MIQSFIFIHLKKHEDKARVLCVMIRKLLALVAEECAADSPDAVSNQEVSVGYSGGWGGGCGVTVGGWKSIEEWVNY